ncbi:MAG TPA: ATP-dependent Clp protease ATP-binding subunit ClpA, partial [Desulfarculaceae bacterium]|nr:ATP-dependent Clp protease ATP-binding subunit ClpA [Desulfarculaceae bacterium]
KKALEKLFTPEFRNRLDEIIFFHPLNQQTMLQVVDKFIARFDDFLKPRKVQLSVSAEVRLWLAKNGFDPKFGARPLDRLIQDKIKDPLADSMLFGDLKQGGKVKVVMKNNKPEIETTP